MRPKSLGKIAIVASGQLCRAPRVLKEASTLSEAGYDVTAVMVANVKRFEEPDTELLRRACFRKIVVDHLSPNPRTRLRAFVDRAQTWVARRAVRFGVESPHAFGPYRSLFQLARDCNADLTIVHNELGLCVGRALLRIGRKVAADFEDWHSQDLLPEAQRSRPRRLLESTERLLMRQCTYVSTTSDVMSRALSSAYAGSPPVVVRNTFPLQPEPRSLPRNSPPSFFWFSQTIGPGRGLEQFVAAWGNMHVRTPLCLLGEISSEFGRALHGIVPVSRRPDIRFLPLVPPQQLPSVIAQHDIGLALEPAYPANKDLTISNKILQYLDAGLAVLATATAGQREVVASSREAAVLIDLTNTEQLTAVLDNLAMDSARLRAMGHAARKAAETLYSWPHDAPRLLQAVADAVAQSRSRQSFAT